MYLYTRPCFVYHLCLPPSSHTHTHTHAHTHTHTHSQDYLEKSKYITEQLSVLKTQMEDLKVEDRITHNDLLHEENIRHGGTKRALLDKVGVSTNEQSYYGTCTILSLSQALAQ